MSTILLGEGTKASVPPSINPCCFRWHERFTPYITKPSSINQSAHERVPRFFRTRGFTHKMSLRHPRACRLSLVGCCLHHRTVCSAKGTAFGTPHGGLVPAQLLRTVFVTRALELTNMLGLWLPRSISDASAVRMLLT